MPPPPNGPATLPPGLARDAALLRLDSLQLPGLTPASCPPRRLPQLPPRDASLADAIYLAAVKSLLRYLRILQHFSRRPTHAIDPLVLKVLLVGLAQLDSITRIHPAVVVDEAVEQARRFHRPKAAGMVNAVLRNVIRNTPPLPQLHPSDALSVPLDLWNKTVSLLGQPQANDFFQHANRPPALTLRLIADSTPEQLLSALDDNDPDKPLLQPHHQPGILVAENARRRHLARWSDLNLAQPQDPTAARVVPLCDIQPGMTLLDRCAGLGTKTMQLAAATGPTGNVHAIDPSHERCQALARVAAQRATSHVHIHQAAWLDELPNLPPHFDRILADVPCSNSGVLARRAEARYHQDTQQLRSLERLQWRILTDSAPRLRPGGLLIYSTCSVWPEENSQLVHRFLAQNPLFSLQLESTTWPHGHATTYRDGGYLALLLRKP